MFLTKAGNQLSLWMLILLGTCVSKVTICNAVTCHVTCDISHLTLDISYMPLLSIDMKTKVVQHVTRINRHRHSWFPAFVKNIWHFFRCLAFRKELRGNWLTVLGFYWEQPKMCNFKLKANWYTCSLLKHTKISAFCLAQKPQKQLVPSFCQ